MQKLTNLATRTLEHTHIHWRNNTNRLQQRMSDYFQTTWSLNHGIETYEVSLARGRTGLRFWRNWPRDGVKPDESSYNDDLRNGSLWEGERDVRRAGWRAGGRVRATRSGQANELARHGRTQRSRKSPGRPDGRAC